PPTAFSPLSLHDALPISFDSLVAPTPSNEQAFEQLQQELQPGKPAVAPEPVPDIQPLEFNFEPAIAAAKTLPVEDTSAPAANSRSEEHTSELQSRENLVC